MQANSAVVACRETYKTSDNFLKLFNPDMQYDYCVDIKRAYTGKAPTLSVLNDAFGKNITEAWLAIQIRDLSEFSGCKDKLDIEQIDKLAKVIIASFKHLKVTELMHFFLQFKSGKYGKFYGAVDGLVITEALQEFCRERNETLYNIYEEKRKREKEIEDEKNRKEVAKFHAFLAEHECTVSEWLANKDLFGGQYTTEQIKAELSRRREKQHNK